MSKNSRTNKQDHKWRYWPGQRSVLLLLVLCGYSCAPNSPDNERKDQQESTIMKSPIEIQLLVSSTRLSMSERDQFRIGLVAANTSNTAVDPHLFAARLFVNGTPSAAFDLTLGNVMPPKWDNLPAGDTTARIDWALGTALFTEPGEYALELRLEWEGWAPVSSSATVIVTP